MYVFRSVQTYSVDSAPILCTVSPSSDHVVQRPELRNRRKRIPGQFPLPVRGSPQLHDLLRVVPQSEDADVRTYVLRRLSHRLPADVRTTATRDAWQAAVSDVPRVDGTAGRWCRRTAQRLQSPEDGRLISIDELQAEAAAAATGSIIGVVTIERRRMRPLPHSEQDDKGQVLTVG